MKAWHKDGAPGEHPEPWGLSGVFTTVRVLTDKKISFFDSHLSALLIQPTVSDCPGFQVPKLLLQKWKNFW